ncbi:hypothetical protein Pelo_7094 [Pelomyxa schiedti]|nr:hypothetical protein Pelo_7094 [Pelomyxa schiedti]
MNMLKDPDYRPPFVELVEPENDPEKKTVWSEPYYPLYDMQIQVMHPLYFTNGDFGGTVAATISMADTSNLIMDTITSTPNGFNLLVSSAGCILSASNVAYDLLFGPDLNLTVKSQICLSSAVGWDFSELISNLGSAETRTITHDNATWIFSQYPLDLLPWSVVIAVPTSDIISSGNFSITPEVLNAEVLPSNLPVQLFLQVKNTGVIPVTLHLSENFSSALVCNLSGTIVLGGSESTVISVTYGSALPFSGSLKFDVQDTVSEFGLCFKAGISVPISIYKMQIGLKIGTSIGCIFALGLTVAVFVLIAIIKYFKNKVSVLSQPLSTKFMNTPAEAAIKKLKAMQTKRRVSKEDSLVLDRIIQLIACNGLHRVDFTAEKKAKLAQDEEVDKYLHEAIAPYSQQEEELTHTVEPSNAFPMAMSNLDDWDFCLFKYTPETVLVEVTLPIVQTHGIFSRLSVSKDLFKSWLEDISKGQVSTPIRKDWDLQMQKIHQQSISQCDTCSRCCPSSSRAVVEFLPCNLRYNSGTLIVSTLLCSYHTRLWASRSNKQFPLSNSRPTCIDI